ncbi:MAG TPA: class I SAM-dependent methyltransferase [Candidatus Binataceae bacterium]|nr:class I SAM-dependent methyltransferase [Candidatus Binataceae bacterium]
MEQFNRIYEKNEWGYGSGVGSLPLNNIEYIKFVQNFLVRNKITSVVDLGCGDWQFSRFIDWSGIDYTGFDIVENVVSSNQRAFARSNIRFRVFTSIEEVQEADLLLCKDVMQHLSNRTVQGYLRGLKTRFRYLLITNDEWPTAPNREIADGDWRPIRIDQPPFSESAPVVLTWTITWGGWKPTVKSTSLIIGARADGIAAPRESP